MRHQDVLRTLKRMIQKEKSPKTRSKLVRMYKSVLALAPKVKSIAKFNHSHARAPYSAPLFRAFTPSPIRRATTGRGRTAVARVKTPARPHTAADSVVPILVSPTKFVYRTPSPKIKVSPSERKRRVTFAKSVK